MILKSKAAKYERQETREKAEAATKELDEDLSSIRELLAFNTAERVQDPEDEFDNLMSQIRYENDAMKLQTVPVMPKVSDDPNDLPK